MNMNTIIHMNGNGRSKPGDPMTKIGDLIVRTQPSERQPPAEVCWVCPVCGPIPPLQLPMTGRWIRRSCECQRRARAEEVEASMREARAAEMRYRCFGGWLGQAFADRDVIRELAGKTFLTYDQTRFTSAYIAARSFAAQPRGNLVLYGSFGVGKTHLESAICNELRARNVQCYFTPAPQFFLAYNDLLMHNGDAPGLLKRAQTVPLLVLDDIDKARPTEARWDTYWMILNARYAAGRPTVLSTNRMDTLHEYIGEATVSRLNKGMMAIEMTGNDYRLEEDV